jgi:hypothetical protein
MFISTIIAPIFRIYLGISDGGVILIFGEKTLVIKLLIKFSFLAKFNHQAIILLNAQS